MTMHRKFLIYNIIHIAHVCRQFFVMTFLTFEVLDSFEAILMALVCVKSFIISQYTYYACIWVFF